ESAGIYWSSPGGTAGCEVKFRKAGESAWRAGLPMWYDARDAQCRGSLVHLDPNTNYEVELNLPGQAATRALGFRTWSNSLPVAKVVTVNGGSGTFNISEGGSAAGYVVYQGAGTVLDAANGAQFNVTVNASYVIVRGLTLRGAQQDAIRISPSVHDVVIEDNDISGWGRTRDGRWGADMDSGIRALCSQPTLERVTIQRNRIHDPRYSANSWSDGHPAGPQGITFSYCGGNHVIRHNEIFSNNGNQFNDVIGGEDNFTKSGFPNADSDVYGNRLSNSWDDGIEAEGANENVRIWGNYIDNTATGIATTVTSVGPLYIFRNVYDRNHYLQSAAGNPDADDRQVFLKSGSDASLGDGRRYVFHNTMLQSSQAGAVYTLGAGAAIGGTGSTQLINNTVSKNNVYQIWKAKGVSYQFGSGNEFANDLYNGSAGDASYSGAIVGTPLYAAGNGPSVEGNYRLAPNSPGFGRGVRLANFNDTSASPDVGAHQSGGASMAFGIAASSGSAVSGSSNTTNTNPVVPPTNPTPPSTPSGVAMSTAALNFGAVQSSQSITYTNNTSVMVTFIRATMSSGMFGQSNSCADIAPGASCTATVTYYPGNSGSTTGTLTLTSSAPNSPHVVSLTGSLSSGPADVLLTQSVNANPGTAGKDVVFTMTAANRGPGVANNVVVTASYDTSATVVWVSPECVKQGAAYACSVSGIANGAQATFKLVLRRGAAGTVSNSVSITGSNVTASTAKAATALVVTVNGAPAASAVARYRLYSPVTREHHFTTDVNEYNVLASQAGTWVAEGVAGKVLNNPGSFNGVAAVPYYRLYDANSRQHHWTSDANEYYTLDRFPGWTGEGIDGYILPTAVAGAVKLYRLVYPYVAGLHHWTTDANEYNTLIASYGWVGEGGSGFVID
ncbi:MAG TPA: right-handed parallel beta-helix repeat-containing protein, partial [Usitatibacter sp.]|nr:right-handed parallel beta-helix repeat-containing protein [Usitatibacter sp.]